MLLEEAAIFLICCFRITCIQVSFIFSRLPEEKKHNSHPSSSLEKISIHSWVLGTFHVFFGSHPI